VIFFSTPVKTDGKKTGPVIQPFGPVIIGQIYNLVIFLENKKPPPFLMRV
jgi:hypothetical protein